MTKDGSAVSGDRLAELDAVAHRLVLRESSLLSRFLRSTRVSGRTSWPSILYSGQPDRRLAFKIDPTSRTPSGSAALVMKQVDFLVSLPKLCRKTKLSSQNRAAIVTKLSRRVVSSPTNNFRWSSGS